MAAAIAAALIAGCAAAPRAELASTEGASVASSLRIQLAGHLERARGCFSEARMRDPNASGLVRLGFTIQPSGRVEDVAVDAWSEDEQMLAACVRSRVVALYFDPAPPTEPVRVERTFYFCPDESGGMCRLGGARALGPSEASAELLARVDEGLRQRDDELEACARRVGGRPAVFDVRLELGANGRIMSGQLNDASPAETELSRCAVGPLLGASVEGDAPAEPMQLRYVYRLGSTGDERRAER
jgi:hypothetical protein